MKSLLCVVFLLCLTATTVSALKCYECTSRTSWSDCESNRTYGRCDVGLHRCVKLYINGTGSGTGELFIKGCGTSFRCDDYCKTSGFKMCQLNCCSDDYCNGAATLASGAIAIAASILVALRNLS